MADVGKQIDGTRNLGGGIKRSFQLLAVHLNLIKQRPKASRDNGKILQRYSSSIHVGCNSSLRLATVSGSLLRRSEEIKLFVQTLTVGDLKRFARYIPNPTSCTSSAFHGISIPADTSYLSLFALTLVSLRS